MAKSDTLKLFAPIIIVSMVALVAIMSVVQPFSNPFVDANVAGEARKLTVAMRANPPGTPPGGCTDECTAGSTGCAGSYRWVCGEDDGDECLDRVRTYCSHGCSGGSCNSAPTTPDDDPSCGGHDQDICSSSHTARCDTGVQHCFDDDKCWYCCGDGTSNNICGEWDDGTACKGDPNHDRYDTDCDLVCLTTFGSTGYAGIHDVITVSGQLYSSYNDEAFINLLETYWLTSGSGQWGHGWLAGYGTYSLTRVALEHRSSLSPRAKDLLDCLLADAVDYPVNYGCGGKGNSCIEDALGGALTFAAANAWEGTSQYDVAGMINLAFSKSTSTSGHVYLLDEDGETKLYNHNSENPVYAVAMMGHVHHIKKIYDEAGLSFPTLSSTTRQNINELYSWTRTKLDGGEFATSGCRHANGVTDCPCDDGQKAGTNCGNLKRSTQHYPLTLFLSEQGMSPTSPFPSSCSSGQTGYNRVFNCQFI